jgi:hypothetical protein
MSLEDVCTVEGFLRGRSRARAETTHHGTLIMSKGMSVFIILSGKTFDVVIASKYRALLWSFILVRKHMGLQVLEQLSALRVSASSLFFRLLATEVTTFAAIRWLRSKRRSAMWRIWI